MSSAAIIANNYDKAAKTRREGFVRTMQMASRWNGVWQLCYWRDRWFTLGTDDGYVRELPKGMKRIALVQKNWHTGRFAVTLTG